MRGRTSDSLTLNLNVRDLVIICSIIYLFQFFATLLTKIQFHLMGTRNKISLRKHPQGSNHHGEGSESGTKHVSARAGARFTFWYISLPLTAKQQL